MKNMICFKCPKCLKIQPISMDCNNCSLKDPCGFSFFKKEEDKLPLNIKSKWTSFFSDSILSIIISLPISYVIFSLYLYKKVDGKIIDPVIFIVTISMAILATIRYIRYRSDTYKQDAFDRIRKILINEQRSWEEFKSKKIIVSLKNPEIEYKDFSAGGSSIKSLIECIRPYNLFYSEKPQTLREIKNYVDNIFALKMQNIIRDKDGKFELTFEEALEQIAAVDPNLDKQRIQHEAFLISKLTRDELSSYSIDLSQHLCRAFSEWQGSSFDVKMAKKNPYKYF